MNVTGPGGPLTWSCAALIGGLLLAMLTVQPLPARAVDTVSSNDAPDLSAVRARIKAKAWPHALADLRVIANTVEHADVYNLLGFVHRNMGAHKSSLTFYKKALDFNPDHKGAHEYLGELYVKVGDMSKARDHERALIGLCPAGCEELVDLRAAIAAGPGTASMTD